MGAHLAKRLADAAREGPGAAGTATGPEPSVLARELAPWSALLHGVAQCEVSSRPVRAKDDHGSNSEPRPPQPAAATAAEAVEMLPAIAPPSTRAKTSTQKLAASDQKT